MIFEHFLNMWLTVLAALTGQTTGRGLITWEGTTRLVLHVQDGPVALDGVNSCNWCIIKVPNGGPLISGGHDHVHNTHELSTGNKGQLWYQHTQRKRDFAIR